MVERKPVLTQTIIPVPKVFHRELLNISLDSNPGSLEVVPVIFRSDIEIRSAAALTTSSRVAEVVSAGDRGQVILDAMRSTEPQQVRGGRGRGPCPGCMEGTPEGHHGGSKCSKRGQSHGSKLSTSLNIRLRGRLSRRYKISR